MRFRLFLIPVSIIFFAACSSGNKEQNYLAKTAITDSVAQSATPAYNSGSADNKSGVAGLAATMSGVQGTPLNSAARKITRTADFRCRVKNV